MSAIALRRGGLGGTGGAGGVGGTPSLATQVGVLARRSLLRTLRQPAQIIPSMVFPLFMLAVNASGLKSATNIPGFPTHSYITFALAVPFMQGALFAVINAGTDVAHDVETGFLNRLQLTPVRSAALLTGELAGVVAFGLVTTLVYLGIGLAFGAHITAGVGGVLVLLALAAVVSLGFGALGVLVALRTGSGEAVQGMFPLFFVLLFLSSLYLPRNLIRADWFHTIANWNPVSYILEGIRSVLITGWDGTALGRAFAIVTVLALVAIAASAVALRSRMGRT
jgi:ABC-2 type transport system permease protein